MSAWLQCGKMGDIISILPMLCSEHMRTGEPQTLITTRPYLSLLLGLDYVVPVEFDGDWMDYEDALLFGKRNFGMVKATQMFGRDINFTRHCPSVFLDMWKRGGMLKYYDMFPLDLPFKKLTSPARAIFYADHSQSSPFVHREELMALLRETFPEHNIIRASSVRMRTIRDFLPIMDSADLIVSVDTSFLHLSRAVNTPVIAMVTSRPDPWRATPWSKRFAFHCRYDAFLTRKTELVAAMNAAVNKLSVAKPSKYVPMRPHAYNMTILGGVDNLRIYRYHVNGWKTKLALDNGKECWDIIFPAELDEDSVEDARLFRFNGKVHIAYTVARAAEGFFKCIQAYGPLEFDGSNWRLTSHIVPKVAGNDFTTTQKNYVPIVSGKKLYFIYGIRGENQVIHEIVGDKVISTHEMPAPKWPWGEIRGGSVVEYKGQLIRFFHSRIGQGHKHYQFRYYIGAAIMEREAPFRTQMVSSFPILAGNEKYADCSHWKPNCCLPYGATIDGDQFEISGGINDCECFTMKLVWKDLNL